MKKLIRLFAITATTLFSNPSFGQDNELKFVKQSDKALMRDKIFEQALIKSYVENPIIYDAHRKALQGKAAGDEVISSLNRNAQQYKFYRYSSIPLVSEHGMIEWEERKKEFNTKLLEEMGKDPTAVETVASEMRAKLYNIRKSNQYLVDVYNDTKKIAETNKLPPMVELDGLIQQYPEIADKIKSLGLDAEQTVKFFSGKMDKEEFKKIKNMDEKTYNTFIYNIFLNTPDATDFSNSAIEERNREVALKNHTEIVNSRYADLEGGVAILALIDKSAASKISKVGEASLKIYDGIGKMLISKSINISNLGSVAGGVGIIFSLFSKDPTQEALNKVLENQKLMLEKLDAIDTKVTRMDENIHYLVSLTQYNTQEILAKNNSILNRISEIESLIYSTKEYQRQLMQEELILDFERRKGSLLYNFSDVGSLRYKELTQAIRYPSKMSIPTKMYFAEMKSLLGEMAVFATQQLENKNYITYSDRTNIDNLQIADILQRKKQNINPRVGTLPSIGSWLHSYLNLKNQNITYSDKLKDNTSDGSGLIINIANPELFTHVLTEYIDLSSYYPIESRTDGTIQHNDAINAFCSDLNDIENTISEMQRNVPLAMGIMDYNYKLLKNRHIAFVSKRANLLHIDFDQNCNSSKYVLYAGLNENQITSNLMSMNEDGFAKLALKLNVVSAANSDLPDKASFVKYDVGNYRNDHTITVKDRIERTTKSVLYPGAEVQRHESLSEYVSKQWVHVWQRGPKDSDRDLVDQGSKEINLDISRRAPLARAMAKVISERRYLISKDWADYLRENEGLVLKELIKSNYVFETLLAGGYGENYKYIPELSDYVKKLNMSGEIIRFIIEDWEKGNDILDYEIEDQVASYSQGSQIDILNADGNIQSNKEPAKNAKKLSYGANLFAEYISWPISTEGKFLPFAVSDDSIKVIVEQNMPIIKTTNLVPIGNLDKAKDALKWASQFEDIAPPKNFFTSPSPKPN